MFGKEGKGKRILAGALCAVLLAGSVTPLSVAAAKASDATAGEGWKELLTAKYAEDSYARYAASFAGAERTSGPRLAAADVLAESVLTEAKPTASGGQAVYLAPGGKAVWSVTVAESGWYRLAIGYEYFDEGQQESDLTVELDGKVPFYQAAGLALPRIWTQETLVHAEGANDVRPDTLAVQEAAVYVPADESGVAGDYRFRLEAGTHKLGIASKQGGFGVCYVQLGGIPAAETVPAASFTGDVIRLEAEDYYRKNDESILGGTDRSDVMTTPNDPMYKKINTLAGDKFLKPGQSVTWKFHVKQAGRYRLNIRYLQESLPGAFASRNVYIDGAPVAVGENAVKFPYVTTWQLATAESDGKELLLDLAAGDHTVTLEVTLGRLQAYVQRMDDVIFALNTLYRKIIMITGTTPDTYRDYHLEQEIPYLIPYFKELYAELDAISEGLKKEGAESGILSVLDQTAEQLREFTEDSYRLQDRLAHYVSNISALSSLIMQMQEGPVSIDCLWLESTEQVSVVWQSGFFESVWFHIQAFLGSFFCDYSSLGNTVAGTGRETVTAWFGGSREQSEMLQDIINEDFGTKEPGISVNLKLVTLPLTQAILAGTAPDVCLSVGRNQPINLGCRGVLEDLSDYEGFAGQKAIFGETLLTPYTTVDGKVYGLPVTLDYHMMFYRTDIFEELGLEPPDTWDDFYALIPILQRNNLYIGLPYTMMGAAEGSLGVKDIFATLLLQKNVALYNEDLSAVRLDDPAVAEVFRQWTEFYSKYQFSLEYNLYNRFRTGEMPLGIISYSFYNQLAGAAPEIKGMWRMVPIPGTKQADGTVDRTQAASGTAAILLKDSKHKEAAWKFLSWWVSAGAQGAYGNALETLMGESARYTPANPDAVALLPWDEENYAALMAQREMVEEFPEVLGGYYVVRSIDNAFRNVLYSGANYKEALLTQHVIINTELERKQREFKK